MGKLFTWSQTDLTVSVTKMDDEHQKLIDIMNRLHERNEANAPKQELSTILNELGEYTVKHFTHEEAYMESINYPKLSIHKTIHASLLEKFSFHKKDFLMNHDKVSREFFDFLTMWLRAHIQGIDRQYGDFSKTGKIAS
jgi:hemerythrin